MRPAPTLRIRIAAIAALSLALAAGGCGRERRAGGGSPGPGSRPPSILILSIDTLRGDHLGCAGYSPYGEPVSPEIDRFAKESARFTQCFAPRAQTMPSLTSMLTGRYPSSHGILENTQPLDTSVPTMAELLGARGYDTAAFLSFIPPVPDGNLPSGSRAIVIGRDSGPGGAPLESQWQWDAATAVQTI